MKIKISLILSLLIILITHVQSQKTWNSPKEAVEWMNSKIAVIKLVDRTVKQNLVSDLEKGSKCELFYSVEYDGTVTFTKLSLFYWENINVDAIEATVKGKELFLSIPANDGSKFIKEKKSGDEAYLFSNKIQMYFDDIQTARNAIECFKYLKKESPPFQPVFNTKLDAYTYLQNEIGKIIINTNEYDQSLTVQTDQNDKFLVTIKETDSRGVSTTKRYEFYMTDFNGKSVSVKTYPAKLSIELISSSEIKPVKYFINDIQQNYTNKIELHADDVQKAYILKNTFIYLTGEKTEDFVKSEKKSAAEVLFPHHFKEKEEIQTDTLVLDYSNSDIKNCPEIEFSDRPYFYLPDNSIDNLERVDGTYEFKAIGAGYGGSEGYLTVFGKNSQKSYTVKTLPKIIIKVNSGTDPMDIISVVKGEIAGDRRRFIIRKNKMYGKVKDISDAFVNFRVVKIKEQYYEIIFDSPLTKGEYIFLPVFNPNTTNGSTVKVSCFGMK